MLAKKRRQIGEKNDHDQVERLNVEREEDQKKPQMAWKLEPWMLGE